jgi:predicted RND superfamily exporter protein
MRYKVGADVGFVLAKGIFISFISVILLMPVLIKMFSKTLDRTRHRLLLPSFGILGRFAHKARYIILIIMLVIITPAFLAQDKNDFIYGDNSVTAGEGQAYENRLEIKEKFGIINNIVILIPNDDPPEELELIKDLRDMPYTKDVVSLLTVADPAIPSQFLPEQIVSEFVSSHHSRLILYLNIEGETARTFAAVEATEAILEEHYPGKWYAAGISTSLSDIRDTVRQDSRVVALISLLAVGFVVLLVFRSISIPVILLLVIQSSVWINMAIPYFTNFSMAFIGYLVISSLQLGATIDYGILLTNRYMEFRKSMDPKTSLYSALNASGPSILVSAMILSTAGFGFAIVSQVGSISELGLLIGRGALLSCAMTLILLPAMLYLFDKIILRTTLKREEKNENKT